MQQPCCPEVEFPLDHLQIDHAVALAPAPSIRPRNARLSRGRVPSSSSMTVSSRRFSAIVTPEDYYKSNSARAFLSSIALPTLIVHTLDDPWIPRSCYDAVEWARLPTITTAPSPHGGRQGFHGVGSRIPWHDRLVLAWRRERFEQKRD
jgi:hypothetical protein